MDTKCDLWLSHSEGLELHALLEYKAARMLFDVFFFGFPIIFALCLGAHAVREEDARFWRPAFSFFAYCAFYLAGGRDVILYILCGFIVGGSWLSVGGFCPGFLWTMQALLSSL